jgi:phenylacetate-CoA ligase
MSQLPEWLIRHVLWPFYIERDAPGMLREWRALEASQWWPRQQLEALRAERLKALLEHARLNVPFYERRFQDAGVDPRGMDPVAALAALPPLEKRDIQDSRMELRARNLPASELIENRTGGSTGSPLVFDLDRARSASRYAAELRADRWTGWEPGAPWVGLWGANRDLATPRTFRQKLRRALLGEYIVLDASRISPEQLRDFVARLPRVNPVYVIGYSRALALAAAEATRQRIRLPRLKAVVSSAEMLAAEERRRIEEGFGVRVFDRYGAREVSLIASECEAHQWLHINAENLWIEIVDGQGRGLPAGESGQVLVTDLRNVGMPLIRYRIGDVSSLLEGECACGRQLPRLAGVTGRITDFLLLPDGSRVSGAALTIFMVAELADVRQVQLVQRRREEVTIRIVPGDNYGPGTEATILDRARQKLGEGVAVRVERVAEIPVEASGKYRFSISEAV